MKKYSLGYSPCPNDTFIFYALVHGKIDLAGLFLEEPVLQDVEQLNSWALSGRLDITKLSFHALGHVLDEYCVLSAGSALGRGCGPLLIAGSKVNTGDISKMRIAIPGRLTTAALLLQMFLPGCTQLVEMRFDHIMDAIMTGYVDGGVIIHESRFTYKEKGLICLQDLGEWWEEETGMPIPLGCIAVRRDLGEEIITRIDRAISDSVAFAFAQPASCLPYIRSKSQETDPDVVQSHIQLYVNDFSKNIGNEGLAAVQLFLEKGRKAGVLPESSLEIMQR